MLAFHVTYWDRLGWRDPFGLQAATARQNDYASTFGSVFTPQMVIDGAQSVVGSDRANAGAAIAQAQTRRAGPSVTLRREGATLRIGVGPGHGSGLILLVGFDHEHSTQVGRGENSGRTLVESDIVRAVTTAGSWSGRKTNLPAAPPAGEDAAALVQASDGSIIGAAKLER